MFDFLLALIKREDLEKQINLTDNSDNTIAHFAAQHGNLDLLKKLASLGGNVSALNKEGEMPVHQAISHDQETVIPFFMALEKVLLPPENPLDTTHFISQAINHGAHKVLFCLMISYNMRFQVSALDPKIISHLSPQILTVLLECTEGGILEKIKLLKNFTLFPSEGLILAQGSLKIDIVSALLEIRIKPNPELLIYYTFLKPKTAEDFIKMLLVERKYQPLKEVLEKIVELEEQHPAFEMAKYYLTQYLTLPGLAEDAASSRIQQPRLSNFPQRFLKAEVERSPSTEDSVIAKSDLKM